MCVFAGLSPKRLDNRNQRWHNGNKDVEDVFSVQNQQIFLKVENINY